MVFEIKTPQGVPLLLGDDQQVITLVMITWKTTIGDEGALSKVWNHRSASASLFCMSCYNVVTDESGLAEDDTDGEMCTMGCTDHSRFKQRTHKDACEVHDYLEAMHPVTRKTPFVQMQQAAGMTYNPDGLLAYKELREHLDYQRNRFDSMHCCLASGTLANDIWLFLVECTRAGIDTEHINMLATSLSLLSTGGKPVGEAKKLLQRRSNEARLHIAAWRGIRDAWGLFSSPLLCSHSSKTFRRT